MSKLIKRYWNLFLARFHLSEKAVCEMSKGESDYHDYPDDIQGYPCHFSVLKCRRCGKEFTI